MVSKRLFDDKNVDLDKIYVLFAFSGKLSIDCMNKDIPQVIGDV